MEDFFCLDQTAPEESLLIRRSVRQYVEQAILPDINTHFENATFADQHLKKLAELGVFGITLAPEFGGSGASYFSYGMMCQELERGDSAWRSLVSVQNSLVIFPIVTFGDAQHHAWLPKLISGEAIGCFGLTEPNSGSDPSSLHTRAERGDGGWILNGAKMWITSAPIADIAIVWAQTAEGIRGFLVETDREGLSCPEIKHKLSLRASPTGELVMQNCWIPEENLLPKTERGLACALQCLTQARFGIAWGAMGAAKACFERTLAYTKERKQFGRPLAANQLIQQSLVDMHSEIVKADCLNAQLALLKDAGKATPQMVSLAKRNACRSALAIVRECRNCLGGNGISLEYDVIRHMNNLESVFTYEGTDNIHTLILGKHLTGLDAF